MKGRTNSLSPFGGRDLATAEIFLKTNMTGDSMIERELDVTVNGKIYGSVEEDNTVLGNIAHVMDSLPDSVGEKTRAVLRKVMPVGKNDIFECIRFALGLFAQTDFFYSENEKEEHFKARKAGCKKYEVTKNIFSFKFRNQKSRRDDISVENTSPPSQKSRRDDISVENTSPPSRKSRRDDMSVSGDFQQFIQKAAMKFSTESF
jgi:hypothetical protein